MRKTLIVMFLLSLMLMMTGVGVQSVYADGEISPIYINDNGDFVVSSYVEDSDGTVEKRTDGYSLSEPYIFNSIIETKYVKLQPKNMEQNRFLINTQAELKWKAMWNDTDVEITTGMEFYLNTGQKLEFRNGYWCVNVTSDIVGVKSYYITVIVGDDISLFEPDIGIKLIWDYIVIIIITTGTITTITSTVTDVVDFTNTILITIGLSIGLVLVVVLFIKSFIKTRKEI